MKDKPLVSIVIVCMNRPDNLFPCLESIRANTQNVDYETIVVAYRFSPDNLAKSKAAFPWVTFIESNEIRGFSENNNIALKTVKGDFCFVVNDDTEMHMDVVGKLVSDFSKLPSEAAIITPKLLNADGSLQLCGRPDYPARYYIMQQWHVHREAVDDTDGKDPIFDEVFGTTNISGAAFLIKTDIFRELGWFDEIYFFTPEDIALSTLARSKGYGIYVDSAVEIVHKWRTTASKISPAIRPSAVRGSLIFFSGGSSLKYFLIALPVWVSETCKLIKAFCRYQFDPTDANRIKMQTFHNISVNIFSRRKPKEIFKKYYNG